MGRIENIIKLASATARAEYSKRISKSIETKPTYSQFKERVMSIAKELAPSHKHQVSGQFGADKEKEFIEAFYRSLDTLKKGEDSFLEKIIQQNYGEVV